MESARNLKQSPLACWTKVHLNNPKSLWKKYFTYFTLLAPTAAPRNVQLAPKSSTQLEITWEAPTLAHWNSEHLSYKVGYKYVYITQF